ncbi:hypothetical protein DFH06DRAFT_69944 [Mycena polygramma]|nr:hypothetical protein DFH06DRAFT_69944 [Mycena polygramma]
MLPPSACAAGMGCGTFRSLHCLRCDVGFGGRQIAWDDDMEITVGETTCSRSFYHRLPVFWRGLVAASVNSSLLRGFTSWNRYLTWTATALLTWIPPTRPACRSPDEAHDAASVCALVVRSGCHIMAPAPSRSGCCQSPGRTAWMSAYTRSFVWEYFCSATPPSFHLSFLRLFTICTLPSRYAASLSPTPHPAVTVLPYVLLAPKRLPYLYSISIFASTRPRPLSSPLQFPLLPCYLFPMLPSFPICLDHLPPLFIHTPDFVISCRGQLFTPILSLNLPSRTFLCSLLSPSFSPSPPAPTSPSLHAEIIPHLRALLAFAPHPPRSATDTNSLCIIPVLSFLYTSLSRPSRLTPPSHLPLHFLPCAPPSLSYYAPSYFPRSAAYSSSSYLFLVPRYHPSLLFPSSFPLVLFPSFLCPYLPPCYLHPSSLFLPTSFSPLLVVHKYHRPSLLRFPILRLSAFFLIVMLTSFCSLACSPPTPPTTPP